MSDKCWSDFQIGYNYAKTRRELVCRYDRDFIIGLGKGLFLQKGDNAELSQGMGLFYLEMGLGILLERLKKW